MVRLPVRGDEVVLRLPSGHEEIMLRESPAADRALALELVRRVSSVAEPEDLAVHDFEALLLHLRSAVFGDSIQADAACPCGKRVDISFDVRDYLSHQRPRRPRQVSDGSAPGWFALRNESVEFRLPTVRDQMAAGQNADPLKLLLDRCVRPARALDRVERALAALAPLLSAPIEGTCPHCRSRTRLYFDVVTFVVREMRRQAMLIYEDVHLLALYYHWPEAAILQLPRERRERYVDQVKAERGAI